MPGNLEQKPVSTPEKSTLDTLLEKSQTEVGFEMIYPDESKLSADFMALKMKDVDPSMKLRALVRMKLPNGAQPSDDLKKEIEDYTKKLEEEINIFVKDNSISFRPQ